MLSVKQAAKEANVDPVTIYEWLKRGLKSKKVMWGLRMVIRIDKAELYRFIKENGNRGKE